MENYQPPVDGHLISIVDDEWRMDQLPHDKIYVPAEKLPDPEADNGDSHLTLSEQVCFLINRNKVHFLSHFCLCLQLQFLFSIVFLLFLFVLSQERRWTDLSLANLAPELAISDQINISSA